MRPTIICRRGSRRIRDAETTPLPASRANNFDALRLLAAAAVIFSHSFLLSAGRQDDEPLMRLTGSQTILGLVGVFVFFIISGFLVTQSFETTASAPRFLAKRALRIYPALAVCLLLCTFALGPALSALPLADYLASPGTRDFLLSNLVLAVEHNSLPGLRFTGFGIGSIVDGPLWSLPCEAAMYLMVLLLGTLRLLRLPLLLALFALGLARLWLDAPLNAWLGGAGALARFAGDTSWLLAFFVAGMILYKLQHLHIFDARLAALALAGLVASVPLQLFVPLFPLFGGYLVIYVALAPWLPPLPAARCGDLSYGLYIYGWPVQQTLLFLASGALVWWQLFPLSLAAAAAIAGVSWHGIERPALRLKPRPRG
jgi:peptidoglycan/LPS O-acetylase OafA/YrhL